MGKRYGYLDMPDDWSDVDDTPVIVQGHCPTCGTVNEIHTIAESLGGLTQDAEDVYEPSDEFTCPNVDCL